MYTKNNQQYHTFVVYHTYIDLLEEIMDRRIRKSRNALKNSLFTLMKKKSISYISISELCELADVNRSTFYSNYGNITELLSDIHKDLFQAMFSDYKPSISDFSTIETKKNTIYHMIHYVETHKNDITILFTNNENDLLEKNMLRLFMESCNINISDYSKSYPFIYHTMAFFTLLHTWVYNNYPCSAEQLTKIIVDESKSLEKYF